MNRLDDSSPYICRALGNHVRWRRRVLSALGTSSVAGAASHVVKQGGALASATIHV